MIIRLLDILRGLGVDPTAGEIAEMLWLAKHLDLPEETEGKVSPEESSLGDIIIRPDLPDTQTGSSLRKPFETSHVPPGRTVAKREFPQPLQTSIPPRPTEELNNPEEPGKAGIYRKAPDTPHAPESGLGGLPFKTPAVSALPRELAVGRALRPLMRRVPSRTEFVLDEKMTVQSIADGGSWIPKLRPAPSRWLDVILLVDEWSSMVIWQEMIIDIRQLLERQGAFRNVQVWGFSYSSQRKQIHLHPGTGSKLSQHPNHSFQELIDPSGQRLILAVSDCISPAWYNGIVARMLTQWGRTGQVAIIQVLPQRLWERTGLGNAVPVSLHSIKPGTPNTLLNVKFSWDWMDETIPGGIKVPVTTLEPGRLGDWAKSVAGGNVWIPGRILPTQPSGANQAIKQPPSSSTSDEKLLQIFRATASPLARRLAGYFAAIPLNLPVMRLVQHVMLPESQQIHLAEIFLSGLLQQKTPYNPSIPAHEIHYDFTSDKVRDTLLSTVFVSEQLRALNIVFREISDFIDKKVGKPRNFLAWLADPELQDRVKIGEEYKPFASVATRVLQRLGGEYAQLANRLEQITEPTKKEEGGGQHILLVDAQANWRWILRKILEDKGYQISEAESLEEAKTVLLSSSFDLAILEIRLDEAKIYNVQGLELLQHIKKAYPALKTIILSGYPESIKRPIEADRIFLKGAGFDVNIFQSAVKELAGKKINQEKTQLTELPRDESQVFFDDERKAVQEESIVSKVTDKLRSWFDNFFASIKKRMRIKAKEGFFYVSTVGSAGVGKSTLLAAICYYLQTNPEFIFRYDIDEKARKGLHLLIDDWLESLADSNFPPTTRRGELIEIDIGIQKIEAEAILPLAFLEMSGADFYDAFDILKKPESNNMKLTESIGDILENSDLIIVMAECGDTNEEQALFVELFFEHYHQIIRELNIPILFVVSKIDLLNKGKRLNFKQRRPGSRFVADVSIDRDKIDSENLREIVRENFPNTLGFLKSLPDAEVLPFSVGQVAQQENKIISLDTSYVKPIAEWIYKTLTQEIEE